GLRTHDFSAQPNAGKNRVSWPFQAPAHRSHKADRRSGARVPLHLPVCSVLGIAVDLWVAARGVSPDTDGGYQAGRRRAGAVVLAVVTLDELGAGNVVDLVVLVARICHPAAGEGHDAAFADRLAALVEVAEFVGDPAGDAADRVAGNPAHHGASQDHR